MRILAVGIATLDIISLVAAYPAEDDEVRALDQRMARGGNATNTLVVLSQLGHRCSWGGVLADTPESRYILDDLAKHHIDISHVVRCEDGRTPISCVTLNRQGGSRTIVHSRRLPEFSDQDFSRIDTAAFDWIHFEGSNVPQLEKMLRRMKSGANCSLEIEKPREGIEALFPMVGLLMFSSGYARCRGFQDGAALLSAVRNQAGNGMLMTCAWGERGAWGMDRNGSVQYSPAYIPRISVDTLGAGDVFNAAVIHGVAGGDSMKKYLAAACKLAGEQCGREGLDIER